MVELLHLNLGCGTNSLPGFINADKEATVQPDVIIDLEKQIPWPWPTSSTSFIRLNHVLEHLGQLTEVYKKIWQEIYRIFVNGAKIEITSPWFSHINQVADPTHVRAITPLGLSLLSRKNNEAWIKAKAANSCLALYWGIDFDLIFMFLRSDEKMWRKTFVARPRNDELNQELLLENSNINGLICEATYILVCNKT